MEINSLSREPRLQRRVQLAAGHHIRTKAFFVQDTVHPLAAERLARVGHEPPAAVVAVDRLTVAFARAADLVLVHDIEGGAVGLRQLDGIPPADRQVSEGLSPKQSDTNI